MAAFWLLHPTRNPRPVDCKGGIFWSKMLALSNDAKRFNVRTVIMPVRAPLLRAE